MQELFNYDLLINMFSWHFVQQINHEEYNEFLTIHNKDNFQIII